MAEKKPYLVILFYNYSHIEDPESFQKSHLNFCQKLGLLGRIIVSHEGINGTLSGLEKDINTYMADLAQDPRFSETEFKIEPSDKHVFPRLSVKHKEEIVALKLKDDISLKEKANNYLKPKEFYQLLQKKDVVVLDVRNDYEYNIGHFKNAINPNVRNFRDLPKWAEQNISLLKDKKVLTYCTGGVRCEKMSAFLKQKGVEEVYQLEGGIVKYGQDEEVQGKLFDGQVYVFDERIATKVNQHEHVIVGKDYFDQKPCERYINCANPSCNVQILCSEENEHKYLGSCSKECRKHPKNSYVIKHNVDINQKEYKSIL
ncbi:MAG: rhodanese-related sulfurtransferase [Candidatus Phytoplasma pruni]|uniref:oxygen-dependent tRNA uridine(34) hydroxylase TrhO n=1 Tax=Milkweed yellows phytoplasma TaxID=208434 RepID=UPI00036A1D09|nr:rhodanese-related sulfurtransferase [Milkweed yellows phytoplasma]